MDPVAHGASSSSAAPNGDNGDGDGDGDGDGRGHGRKRARESTVGHLAPSHPQLVGARRVEAVVFSGYEIEAAFSSPYPFDDSFAPSTAPSASTSTLPREGHGRFAAKNTANGSRSRSSKASQAAKRAARRASAASSAAASALAPPLPSPELELGQLEASVGLPSPSLAPAALPPAPPLPSTAAHLAQPHAVLAPIVFTVPASHPTSRRPSASLSPVIGSASLASPPGAKPFVDVVRTTTLPRPPSAKSSPSLTPATIPTLLPTPVPPLSLYPDVNAHANAVAEAKAEAEAARGHGGRFLPKPEGESIKSRRRLAKVARDEQAQANPPEARHVTVREQRERDKAAREAREKANGGPPDPLQHLITKRLFVCHGCFKYMVHERAYVAHEKVCEFKHPPGRKVYQRGAHTIWEVDGANAKLYCQNLCLFGKLFIEHKYMFFDLEGFMFYILTDATPSQDWVIGYFSKEKVSYDDYNLACIVIFPPFQKKNYGTLLIEFSYELSRRQSSSPGTPERPLSDLGLKGYLAYWTGVLVRYFRAVFAARGEPPPVPQLENSEAAAVEHRRVNRRARGWDGELAVSASTTLSLRRAEDGTPIASIKQEEDDDDDAAFEFPTTLADVADATNLRPEDVAYALVEAGLAKWRRKTHEDEDELELVITPQLVDDVFERRKVRQGMVMELAHVLL